MDKLLSALSNAPNIEFPQLLVFFAIIATAVAIVGAFWCIYKVILTILSFVYAVLCIKPNLELHKNDKPSLPPLAANWSSDSSQEAERKKILKLFVKQKAKPKSILFDMATKNSE